LHGVEDGLRDLAQVAGVGVDERELPLEPDRRALRARERDRGAPGERGAHRGPSWRASSPGGASSGSTTSTCWEPPTRVSTIVALASPVSASWRRSCSGVTAVPRFLIVRRPTPRARRYARRRLSPNGMVSSTRYPRARPSARPVASSAAGGPVGAGAGGGCSAVTAVPRFLAGRRRAPRARRYARRRLSPNGRVSSARYPRARPSARPVASSAAGESVVTYAIVRSSRRPPSPRAAWATSPARITAPSGS